MIVLSVPSLLTLSVLAELQQADLITSEECRRLRYCSDVVGVQCVKSPRAVVETVDILRQHEFDTESRLLEGTH